MNRSPLFVAGIIVSLSTAVFADEIRYVEDFSLATNRIKALQQLIPGTEDHYFYHCLHSQNTEQFDQVEQLLGAWIKRYGHTVRVREIQNRQALLTYPRNPQQSLDFLRRRLHLRFNHQRETLNRRPNLPTVLDAKLIARETLLQREFARHKNLQGFEERALDWLVAVTLNPDRRRHLLQRLQRPDYPNLPRLVVDDLNHKYSSGFGKFAIHRQLLRSQLDDCLELKPNLRNQTAFVQTYLRKLHPSADVDWRHDPPAHRAYLDRLWSFVRALASVHNSLKTHVLYRRLAFDRSRGLYNKTRFMQYIKLPRNVSYINRKYLARAENRRFRADLNADFRELTLLPPVVNDEPLVRSYLHHFFVKETTYTPYEPYINDVYLKHNFAETKIVNGLGEAEQWYSLLPPAKYQALKERIDLDFAATNKTIFAASEPVVLDLSVKNVNSLIVKVFEINTGNYYREQLKEINTDVNLDGLVANEEKTYSYDEPPLRRVKRRFEFPLLKQRGVYVVDFIGNGKSSRALIRKGQLQHVVRASTGGYVFTVLDNQNRKLTDATLWLAGHLYRPDKNGTITVPFSNQPGRQPIVLSHGEFSSLAHFQHDVENYQLTAGIFVDRESLLQRKKAQVVIRPSLGLNGTPVTLSVLKDVRLEIASTDHDGVASTQEVSDFKLFEDRESVHEFQVPARLSAIRFTLKAKVKVPSLGQTVDLTASQTFSLNEIDRTEKIEDLHLARVAGIYVVELLGRTGESKADRPVRLAIKHRDFRNPVNVSLKSNAQGQIVLGRLTNITTVTAKGPEGTAHIWPLLGERHTYHREVHGVAGQRLEIPYMGRQSKPLRSELSLLELRGGTFAADRFQSMALQEGLLQISDLPRGDYDLLLKGSGTRIRLRLAAGEQREGYVLGQNRRLEIRGQNPLQIQHVKAGKQAITVRLRNASKFTRVHLFATRYQPAYSAYTHFSRVRDAEPYQVSASKPLSYYVEGRNIGDEYRYIIDRKYARKYPGNLLERPSLILNPWAIRKTETDQQRPQEGDSFTRSPESAASEESRAGGSAKSAGAETDFADLDFLAESSAVLLNLVPDETGIVTIPRDRLGAHQHLHVVAVDPVHTVYRTISLPAGDREFLDLRLATGLDPQVHFTQQKQISVVPAQQKFVLADVASSKFEAYSSLPALYRLYTTLSHDPKLVEFGFILNWHKMQPAEKRAKYSRYACHELNFFLYKKDPKFFAEAVRPYLANKQDKTFLDHWLTGDDLSEFLSPWAHGQLNIVEQILLAQRIEGQRDDTSRHVDDLFDLIPPNTGRFNFLFQTAVKGSALDTDDALGFDKAKADVNEALLSRFQWGGTVPGNAATKGGASAADFEPIQDLLSGQTLKKEAEKKQKARAEKANEEQSAAGEKLSRRRSGRRRGGKNGKFDDGAAFFGRIAGPLNARQLYRRLDRTQEWVENNYYQLPIEQQNAELITVNGFWNDYAGHDPDGPFYSTHLAEASRNFPEMMFALALLDLPADDPDHQTKFDDARMTITTGGPMIVFHEEIKPTRDVARQTPILVSQNFFRFGDRYRHVNNERVDKYVTGEFLVQTVYGCQVVVTNPTSSRQKLDLLLQIPVGAIPVLNGQYTRSVHIDLEPYRTGTVDYHFYFPAAGDDPHYPVHVAQNEQLIAHADAVTLHVVDEPSEIDRESWDFVSQFASDDEVLTFLKQHNLHRIKLERIAFRMKDRAFFQRVTRLLAARYVYNDTLWSYGIRHNVVAAAREYLQHADVFVNQCGSAIDSPLLVIDPVVRKTFQHMDYRPLVNPRAHRLGRRRQILNDRFHAQYHRLLKVLSYRRDLSDDELMAVTYYMLLQDRVDEALEFFDRVNAENLQTRLQHDYFAAYFGLYTGETVSAREITAKYAEHPVDRWRNAFAAVVAQLDEIDGADVRLVDTEQRNQVQTKLAATASSFFFKVEAKKVSIAYQNLEQIEVNYYRMDVELLFSRNPFVQQFGGRFAYIRPNATEHIELPADQTRFEFELPQQLHNSNVLVEIIGGGDARSQAYYSHSLGLQLIENYGQLQVTHAETRKPLSKTYVKVYARWKDGRVRFYKDGYTDLRGRFDYTSLNTNDLEVVDRFSLLVFSEEHGALVREAAPPKQ